MIIIIDYGMGNLKNVYNALKYLNIPCKISKEVNDIKIADKLILPGVGSFKEAMNNINNTGLVDIIKEKVDSGTPLLGICLGMQMLFEKSYENGETEGLGFIKGAIKLIKPIEKVKIPHIGWNKLQCDKKNILLNNLENNNFVYYVHSYAAADIDKENLIAFSSYGGINVPGVVCKNNVYGTQFHPEKSGDIGLEILKNFGEMIK